MPSTRQRRVQELLVQDISEILQREMKDPRIGFVTITDAEVTPDLRHARIYFTVLGSGEEREETGKALNRAAGFIRAGFAKRSQMRYVPELKFVFDSTIDRGARLNALLESVRQENERQEQVSQDESRESAASQASGEGAAERE
jgi:ribosome-binding factor A